MVAGEVWVRRSGAGGAFYSRCRSVWGGRGRWRVGGARRAARRALMALGRARASWSGARAARLCRDDGTCAAAVSTGRRCAGQRRGQARTWARRSSRRCGPARSPTALCFVRACAQAGRGAAGWRGRRGGDARERAAWQRRVVRRCSEHAVHARGPARRGVQDERGRRGAARSERGGVARAQGRRGGQAARLGDEGRARQRSEREAARGRRDGEGREERGKEGRKKKKKEKGVKGKRKRK